MEVCRCYNGDHNLQHMWNSHRGNISGSHQSRMIEFGSYIRREPCRICIYHRCNCNRISTIGKPFSLVFSQSSNPAFTLCIFLLNCMPCSKGPLDNKILQGWWHNLHSRQSIFHFKLQCNSRSCKLPVSLGCMVSGTFGTLFLRAQSNLQLCIDSHWLS